MRIALVMGYAFALVACGPVAPPVEQPAETDAPAPLDTAPGPLEIRLQLADPGTAVECPPESFVWPGCDAYPPAGYSNFYDTGEPLRFEFAPAGVYDVDVALQNGDFSPGPATRVEDVAIGDAPADVDVEVGPGRVLRFIFVASPPGRPDGDICALGRAASDGGSSTSPRVTCRVETADGRVFEATAFRREFLYWTLMTRLCEAGISMRESDYVERFDCDEPVPAEPPAAP